jgi:hypothetical protein
VCSEVVGYPVRYTSETKLYPSFHFSEIRFNLIYKIFDRNVAYSIKRLLRNTWSLVYLLCSSLRSVKSVRCYIFGCNPFYLFIACELRKCFMFPSIRSHCWINLCLTKIKYIVVCGWNIHVLVKNYKLLFIQYVLICLTFKEICESQGLCYSKKASVRKFDQMWWICVSAPKTVVMEFLSHLNPTDLEWSRCGSMDREIGCEEISTQEKTKNLFNSLSDLPLGKSQSHNKFTWYRRNYSALSRAHTFLTQPLVLHLISFSPTTSLLSPGDLATGPLLSQISLIQIRTQYLFNIYLLSFLLSLDIQSKFLQFY